MKHSSKEMIPMKCPTVEIDPRTPAAVSLFMHSVLTGASELLSSSCPDLPFDWRGAPLTTACSELQGVWGGGFCGFGAHGGHCSWPASTGQGWMSIKQWHCLTFGQFILPSCAKWLELTQNLWGRGWKPLGYHLGCYFSEHSHIVLLNLC